MKSIFLSLLLIFLASGVYAQDQQCFTEEEVKSDTLEMSGIEALVLDKPDDVEKVKAALKREEVPEEVLAPAKKALISLVTFQSDTAVITLFDSTGCGYESFLLPFDGTPLFDT